MGDRFYLHDLRCAYCGVVQQEVYYAPSCGFVTHDCFFCGKKNLISMDFVLTKFKLKIKVGGRDKK